MPKQFQVYCPARLTHKATDGPDDYCGFRSKRGVKNAREPCPHCGGPVMVPELDALIRRRRAHL